MTTLAELPTGWRALVTGLPHQHGLARRLIALGLTPGAEVCVLQNRGRGPLIVEAHGARIALGRKQADRVTIHPASAAAMAGGTSGDTAGPAPGPAPGPALSDPALVSCDSDD